MLAQCLRAALASPRASPLNQGRGFIFAQAWVAELFQLQLASEENMTPDLIIGALVALAVLAVFAAIFFFTVNPKPKALPVLITSYLVRA